MQEKTLQGQELAWPQQADKKIPVRTQRELIYMQQIEKLVISIYRHEGVSEILGMMKKWYS